MYKYLYRYIYVYAYLVQAEAHLFSSMNIFNIQNLIQIASIKFIF